MQSRTLQAMLQQLLLPLPPHLLLLRLLQQLRLLRRRLQRSAAGLQQQQQRLLQQQQQQHLQQGLGTWVKQQRRCLAWGWTLSRSTATEQLQHHTQGCMKG
jgi:hypothetical protein